MSFVDYLVQKKIFTAREGSTLSGDEESLGETLGLLEEKGIDKEGILKLRSEYFDLPFRHVNAGDVPADVLRYIPEESALHYQVAPIGFKDKVLEVGIVDPDNIEARDALQFIASKLGVPFRMFLITQGDFDSLLENYKGLGGEVHKALGELQEEISKNEIVTPSPQALAHKNGDVTKLVEDTPITKIVGVMIRHAIEGNASDIHIEHTGEKVRVRFRVDGVLYTSLFLPSSVHSAVVARIKVLSKLRLDEKRKPQDGSFSAVIDERKIDFRVSTFPAFHGEKIVIRILDPGKGVKKLEETGLDEEGIKIVREALKRPYGLVLITGPTGSGKSTTLYTMMSELDLEAYNVVSLEDPVEYNIAGMSQSQVRPEIGYTFAVGLRNILRQDPDIIMVGEIRDKETAHLAIHAALTGHLVFSTLHTNNAAGVIPRLIDMGVDPYLIAPSLVLAIAQRLARRICPTSKKPIPVTGAIKLMIEKETQHLPAEKKKLFEGHENVYEAVPSPECPGGTRGRVGVYELLPIDKELEQAILEKPSEDEIFKISRSKGLLTLKEDALLKCFQGLIAFQTVNEFD